MDSSNSRYIFKVLIDNDRMIIRTNKELQKAFDRLTVGVHGDDYIVKMIQSCLVHPELEKFKNSAFITAWQVEDFTYALMGLVLDYLRAKPEIELVVYQSIQIVKDEGKDED